MTDHNHNPTGRNQWNLPQADNPTLQAALLEYHRKGLSSNSTIATLLEREYGIVMSESSVKRRRRDLGLKGSGATAKSITHHEATQLVLDQVASDPAGHCGVQTIKNNVAYHSGVHLPRDLVSDIMHTHAPEGFAKRDPTAKKIRRFPKVPIGIHDRWSADGHDKLYRIGFPVWAIVDEATSFWLDAWVIPSNRLGIVIGYLFLCCVEKYGGIPHQSTTDCGSETTVLYGLANALRQIFHPEFALDELPAHIYLRSIHNIVIERSWLRLRLDFGDNAIIFFNKGTEDGIYNSDVPLQYELCQWLWPKLLRQELAIFVESRNAARMRKDKSKPGPSGMSRHYAFMVPDSWGGRNCLLPVDVAVVRELKDVLGGPGLLEFVSEEFSQRAQLAYDSLNITQLSFENVWAVFVAMLPLLE